MDVWDGVLLALAGYFAVLSLVRLMLRHRDRLLEELKAQLEAERARSAAAEGGDEPPASRRG